MPRRSCLDCCAPTLGASRCAGGETKRLAAINAARATIIGEELLLLMPESWRELRQLPDRVCGLLEAAEFGGFAAAVVLLDSWGLRWSPGKAAPKYPPPPPGSARLDADRAEGFRAVGRQMRRAHQAMLWREGLTFDYPE